MLWRMAGFPMDWVKSTVRLDSGVNMFISPKYGWQGSRIWKSELLDQNLGGHGYRADWSSSGIEQHSRRRRQKDATPSPEERGESRPDGEWRHFTSLQKEVWRTVKVSSLRVHLLSRQLARSWRIAEFTELDRRRYSEYRCSESGPLWKVHGCRRGRQVE